MYDFVTRFVSKQDRETHMIELREKSQTWGSHAAARGRSIVTNRGLVAALLRNGPRIALFRASLI
jgi:hypothetical protein